MKKTYTKKTIKRMEAFKVKLDVAKENGASKEQLKAMLKRLRDTFEGEKVWDAFMDKYFFLRDFEVVG